MIRFEPRLHIDSEAAGQIETMLMPLFESPTVLVTEAYSFPLAAEITDDGVLVRAATGEEVTAFLTLGIAAYPDDFVWLGDPAMPTGREIKWRERQGDEVHLERACHLWIDEVILKSGCMRDLDLNNDRQVMSLIYYQTKSLINKREVSSHRPALFKTMFT